jgi:hypothetical protein
MILKWICFILVCLDTVSYIVEKAERIKLEDNIYGRIGSFIGTCLGIAARVYVLYGAGTCWLSV